MATFLLICIFLHCLLQGCMGSTCLLLKNCTRQLEDLINRTHETDDISTMIPLCLNFVGKQSELQNCETNAVQTCSLGGHEPEYVTFTRKKFEAKKKCLKDCPNLNDVKICQGYIKYDIIRTSGYSKFCSNYNNVQSTCVDTKLKTCSFRYQLFESGLSEDGRRIVQTICQSGCSTINQTMEIIDSCNNQFSLTNEERRFSECSFYTEYINCIKTGTPCPQFRRVAQYTQPALSEAQTRCEPTTTTSISMAPLTSTIAPTVPTKITGLLNNQSTTTTDRHDVSCNPDSMSVYIPSALLSQNNYLTWTDPHCKVINNGTHYISTVSHTACGTIVKFTHDEVIFENDIFIRQLGATPPTSPNDTIDFGSNSVDTISVQCIYPRRQNVTMSYRPANTHIRFYEKRYGHMDVQLEQYQSDKFVSVISGTSYPREVLLNKDMYIKLRAMHTNTTDIAIKVDSCVATPSAMPADGSLYQLIDHGCPASPAVKLYPSSFDEVKFSVKAFQFKSSPGSIVYIHCQISVCSPTNPQCVTGCKSRHRRDVDEADDSSHLVSGGPYLLVADKGSLQMSTVVAGVCACLAVVATVFAVIGWKRKSTKYNLVS